MREQRLLLDDRLRALDCHRADPRLHDLVTLTPYGEVAVQAALRAHALRPHPILPR